MKVGILFGPASGNGAAARAQALLSRRLAGRDVAVVEGLFGGGIFGETRANSSWTLLEPGIPADYVGGLGAAVAAIASWGADLLICVGGDGLASYAADAMLAGPCPMAMLGVAAGTINVGPIVTMGMEELSSFDLEKLSVGQVGAVEALMGDIHLAYGFNDIVIGDTFLGTLDGNSVSLSARAMLEEGLKRKKLPSSDIAGPSFSVRKNGAAIQPQLRRPAQIIVSPLGAREFYARAVAGILCNASYMKGAAALALFDSVMVKAEGPERGISDFSLSEQLLFEPGDWVELSGFGPEGHIIVDGNPFLRTKDAVQFRMVPDLVAVARMGNAGEGR